MNRAALIITDATTGSWYTSESVTFGVLTSEQLLADLRTLVEKAERHPVVKSVADAAARVRALLPEEKP